MPGNYENEDQNGVGCNAEEGGGNDDGSENGSNNDDENSDQIHEPEQLRKLFIGRLDYGTVEDTLKAYYEKWGKVVDCVVMRDPKTQRSRGFGFVTYSHSHMLDKAQNERPHKIDGRNVTPKRAVPRQDIDRPEAGASIKRLFVNGIGDDHEEEDLRDYFGQYGSVQSVHIVTDRDKKKKRGFAFVEFDDYDPVDKIVLQKSHFIKNKNLDVQKALPISEANKSNRGGSRDGGGRSMGGGRGDNDRRSRNMGGGGWGGGSRTRDNYSQGSGGGGGARRNNWFGINPWDNNDQGGDQVWGNNGGSNFGGGYQQGFGGGGGGGGGGMGGSMGGGMGGSGGGAMRNNYNQSRMNPYGSVASGSEDNFGAGGGGYGRNRNGRF